MKTAFGGISGRLRTRLIGASAKKGASLTPIVGLYLGKRTKVALVAAFAGLSAWLCLPLANSTFLLVFFLSLAATLLLIFVSLREDLTGIKYVTIPALPIFYQGSFVLLANGLNLSAAGILAAGIVLGISFYILMLTQNIFNIAAFRSIGLIRAANVSGNLFVVISAFLAYGVVWLQSWPLWILAPVVFVISFAIFLLAIWSTHLEKISKKDTKLAAILSLVLTQIALALTFWPILPLIAALVLAIGFYVVFGLIQFELQDRLTSKVIYEYVVIAAVILVLILISTRWTG